MAVTPGGISNAPVGCVLFAYPVTDIPVPELANVKVVGIHTAYNFAAVASKLKRVPLA